MINLAPALGRERLYSAYASSQTETSKKFGDFLRSMGNFNLIRVCNYQGNVDMLDEIYRTDLAAAFNTLCAQLGDKDIKAYLEAKILKDTTFATLSDFEKNAKLIECKSALARIKKLAIKIDSGSFLRIKRISKLLSSLEIKKRKNKKPLIVLHSDVTEPAYQKFLLKSHKKW